MAPVGRRAATVNEAAPADRRGTVFETEVGPRAEDTGPVATGVGGPKPVARDRLSMRRPQKSGDRCMAQRLPGQGEDHDESWSRLPRPASTGAGAATSSSGDTGGSNIRAFTGRMRRPVRRRGDGRPATNAPPRATASRTSPRAGWRAIAVERRAASRKGRGRSTAGIWSGG